MDKIRILLISAITLVTLYGVIEFGKFKQANDRQAIAKQHAELPLTDSPTGAEELPKTHKNSDTPQLADTEIRTTPKPTGSDQIITVSTDNFQIRIDKDGGDIIYLALNKQAAQLDTPDTPFVLLQESQSHTYIAVSGLIGSNGTDTKQGRPLFSSSQNTYTLNEGEDSLVVDLTFRQGVNDIIKRFTFHRDDYLIHVDYLIKNNSDKPWKAALYAQIKRDNDKPASESTGMGLAPYLGFATRTPDDRFRKVGFDDLDDSNHFKAAINGGWIAMIQHYFLSAWIFDESKNTDYEIFKSKQSGLNIARGMSEPTVVAPGETGEIHTRFYAGPKDQYRLEKISEGLDLSVDYGFLWMIAQPLYALLYFINNGSLHIFGKTFDLFGGVGNWGFAIIILTLLVKACFYSLNVKAYTSMARMRAIQPKMMALKDRYGDDRQKMSQETMALYKKEGVNPIGGCLPMLVQMPVFIALYWVLMESVELRHAPFIGWIKDLSAMDPYFVLPLLMGVSMYIQQKLQPAPPDPMQAKVMQFLPVIFTFFFLFFPAGLVLYWVVNNIVTIIQQWYITRKLEAKGAK